MTLLLLLFYYYHKTKFIEISKFYSYYLQIKFYITAYINDYSNAFYYYYAIHVP